MANIKRYFAFDLKSLVFSSLYTALIIIGGFISIPIGLVPVAFADFFVMFSATMQNPLLSFVSVVLYLILGIIGLPVFASGKSGISIFLGPTSGFLIGYIALSLIISFFVFNPEKKKISLCKFIIIMLISNIFFYAFGIFGFMLSTALSFKRAIEIALIPFLPGAVLKVVICYILYSRIHTWQR